MDGLVFYLQLLRDKLLSCGTVLHISDLPDDGFSDQDIKKIVQPFGKVSDLLVLRSRNEVSYVPRCLSTHRNVHCFVHCGKLRTLASLCP